MRFLYSFTALLFLFSGVMAQDKVIPLLPASKVNTVNKQGEKTYFVSTPLNAHIVYNITASSLLMYKPDSANGTSVIVCPGGAFHVLNIEHEGYRIAEALAKKGFTVFILKYRLAPLFTDNPWDEMMAVLQDRQRFREVAAPVKKLAQDDVQAAMRWVRDNADMYKLDKQKIGLMGFSAGGSLTTLLASDSTSDYKPAFAAVIYGSPAEPVSIQSGMQLPPLFIAGATDDLLLSSKNHLDLYQKWTEAGGSAEMHLYSLGGHGLRAGISHTWMNRFFEWMQVRGFIN